MRTESVHRLVVQPGYAWMTQVVRPVFSLRKYMKCMQAAETISLHNMLWIASSGWCDERLC